jgi:hypothetical protein
MDLYALAAELHTHALKQERMRKQLTESNLKIYRLEEENKKLREEVEGWKQDSELYQDYLDREKNLYFFANEKRRVYEDALMLLRTNYDLPEEPTDSIPIDVLYEIQLIVNKALKS